MLSAHQLSTIPPEALFDRLATLALAAEANGFDSLWVPDHFTQMTRESEVGETSLEAYTTLAALAVVTSTLRLGTSVTSVTHRHPPILAGQDDGPVVDFSDNAVLTPGKPGTTA